MNLFVREVPESLQHDFKVYCAVNDKTVREAVLDLMGQAAAQVRHVARKDKAA